MSQPRLTLPEPADALRAGVTRAMLQFDLPAGYQSMPKDEQRRLLEEALSDALQPSLAVTVQPAKPQFVKAMYLSE